MFQIILTYLLINYNLEYLNYVECAIDGEICVAYRSYKTFQFYNYRKILLEYSRRYIMNVFKATNYKLKTSYWFINCK